MVGALSQATEQFRRGTNYNVTKISWLSLKAIPALEENHGKNHQFQVQGPSQGASSAASQECSSPTVRAQRGKERGPGLPYRATEHQKILNPGSSVMPRSEL